MYAVQIQPWSHSWENQTTEFKYFFRLPKKALLTLCKYWYYARPYPKTEEGEIVSELLKPRRIRERENPNHWLAKCDDIPRSLKRLEQPPNCQHVQAKPRFFWRIIRIPKYPQSRFEQKQGQFLHFKEVFKREHVRIHSLEETASLPKLFPYHWTQPKHLAKFVTPPEPITEFCQIPHARLFETPASSLSALPECTITESPPDPLLKHFRYLVHCRIPHEQHPQLERQHWINACHEVIRQALTFGLLPPTTRVAYRSVATSYVQQIETLLFLFLGLWVLRDP